MAEDTKEQGSHGPLTETERDARNKAAQATQQRADHPSPPGRGTPRQSPTGRDQPARPPGPANAGHVENREAPHGYGQSGAAPPQDPNRNDGAESSGRYRLLAAHMIGGHWLPAGTEVGHATGYRMDTPSNQMEGVDDAGKSKVNELHQKLYGHDAPWHDPDHPIATAQQEAERAEAQREEDLAQEPVSHQQAWERGHEEFRGDKLSGPPQGPLVTRSVSGDTSQPMGPGSARQDINDPKVQPRADRPLNDQLPKE